MAEWSRVGDESVLHLAMNGKEEWSGTWYRHVRPSLLNYHHNTKWLGHQLVLKGVGHGEYADKHGSDGWGKPESWWDIWGIEAHDVMVAMDAKNGCKAKGTAGKPLCSTWRLVKLAGRGRGSFGGSNLS